MNKPIKLLSLIMFILFFSSQVSAAFVLNSTRYIYDEGKKSISFEVENNSDSTYGGQVWIDNTDQEDGVYFVPQPPFFKVKGGQRQVIRIMKTASELPTDRESLFWLNVQEVPPKSNASESGGSTLALALNTRVKVLFRPKQLEPQRKNAEEKLKLEEDDGAIWLVNPTPYYFALVSLKLGEKDMIFERDTSMKLANFKPFSRVLIGDIPADKVSISSINDWGGVDKYDIH